MLFKYLIRLLVLFLALSFYSNHKAQVYHLNFKEASKLAQKNNYSRKITHKDIKISEEKIRQHYWNLGPELSYQHSRFYLSSDHQKYDFNQNLYLVLKQEIPIQ